MCSRYALCTVRKTSFSPFKSYLQLRETLLSNMLWNCIRGKSATGDGWKTDECISPRSESSFCSSNFLSFSQQHET